MISTNDYAEFRKEIEKSEEPTKVVRGKREPNEFNKAASPYHTFADKLHGYWLFDKFTGRELAKWECMPRDHNKVLSVAERILKGTHERIAAKSKRGFTEN